MLSWVPVDDDSEFPLANLPYGIFSTPTLNPRPGVAIGDQVLDLKILAINKVFESANFDASMLEQQTLNGYAALGRDVHRRVRALLQGLLRSDTSLGHILRDNAALREKALIPLERVKMHMPMAIGDYVDFFTSPYHAKNVGITPALPQARDLTSFVNKIVVGQCTDIFRPGQDVAAGFYKMPLGYGGRSSSVVVSGTPVRRPRGQVAEDGEPKFGPSRQLDFEVEFAAFVGLGSDHGSSIDVDVAEDHIFGVVLLNDWSARDIQRAEAVPLGPLNGKSFCTSISPWIVTLDALEVCRTQPIKPGPLLPYLDRRRKDSVYDIPIDVQLEVASTKYQFARCNTGNTCFSFSQMLAHLTAGGAPMRSGDLFATGTLSGATQDELGCFLEASWGGANPCNLTALGSGSQTIRRSWLEDGDAVYLSGRVKCQRAPGYIGFGGCTGRIVSGYYANDYQ